MTLDSEVESGKEEDEGMVGEKSVELVQRIAAVEPQLDLHEVDSKRPQTDFPVEPSTIPSASRDQTGNKSNEMVISESTRKADEKKRNELKSSEAENEAASENKNRTSRELTDEPAGKSPLSVSTGNRHSADDSCSPKLQYGLSQRESVPPKMQGLLFRNIPSTMTENDLKHTLGIDATKYTETLCSCKLFWDGNDDLLTTQSAIVMAPTEMSTEMVKLNKIEIQNHIIEIHTTPLTFFRVKFDVPNNSVENNLTQMEDKILYFIFEDDVTKATSSCVVLETQQTVNGTNVHAIIATSAVAPNPSSQIGDFLHVTTDTEFYELLQEKAKVTQKETVIVRSPVDEKSDQQRGIGTSTFDDESTERESAKQENEKMKINEAENDQEKPIPSDNPTNPCTSTCTAHMMHNSNHSNLPKPEPKIVGLYVKNLKESISREDIVEVMGIEKTEYLRSMCSCKTSINMRESQKEKFAILIVPRSIAGDILKLNATDIQGKTISVEKIPLEFFEMDVDAANLTPTMGEISPNDVIKFLFTDQDSTDDVFTLTHCVTIEDGGKVTAVVATGLTSTGSKDNQLLNDFVKRVESDRYFDLIYQTFNKEQQKKVAVRSKAKKEDRPIILKNALLSKESAAELIKEVRGYDMNICKQMKKKLLYLKRENFAVRIDKGSSSREQIYVECSTANYEYLRYFLVLVLKEKLGCTEDMSKRRIAKDIDEKSEVEAQYSIQFYSNNIKHSIHLTFYYTKCSIWIQGQTARIQNMTPAQYFVIHYLEKVSNMVQNTVSLEELSTVLETRIISFLTEEETKSIQCDKTLPGDKKCVTCSRKCSDNNKSIKCNKCGKFQHFHCAGIKDESERNMFFSGNDMFT